jgi:hypothetical protein
MRLLGSRPFHAESGARVVAGGYDDLGTRRTQSGQIPRLPAMTQDKWQPDPDRGWAFSLAGPQSQALWGILDSLNATLNGPRSAEVAEAITGDHDPGMMHAVVRFIHDDLSLALGKPKPQGRTQPMPMTDEEKARFGPGLRDNAKAMLADLDAQLDALGRVNELLSAIETAQSRDEAAGRLKALPFGYTDWQAFMILDMTIAATTEAGLDRYQSRRDEIAEALRRLTEQYGPGDAD